jgi:hypothetical protein
MRRDRSTAGSGLVSGLAIAVVIALALRTTGCTPEICSRNSDCLTPLVCTAAGTCDVAPSGSGSDAGTDAMTGDADASIDEIP